MANAYAWEVALKLTPDFRHAVSDSVFDIRLCAVGIIHFYSPVQMRAQPFQSARPNKSNDQKNGRQNHGTGYLFLDTLSPRVALPALGYQFGNEFMLCCVRLRIDPERMAALLHLFDD